LLFDYDGANILPPATFFKKSFKKNLSGNEKSAFCKENNASGILKAGKNSYPGQEKNLALM
jgi:hypothetical protein